MGPIGNTCTPNLVLPNTLSFTRDTETTIRYAATDRAMNLSDPLIEEVTVLIEDNEPT